jgi:hypothetical protein
MRSVGHENCTDRCSDPRRSNLRKYGNIIMLIETEPSKEPLNDKTCVTPWFLVILMGHLLAHQTHFLVSPFFVRHFRLYHLRDP